MSRATLDSTIDSLVGGQQADTLDSAVDSLVSLSSTPAAVPPRSVAGASVPPISLRDAVNQIAPEEAEIGRVTPQDIEGFRVQFPNAPVVKAGDIEGIKRAVVERKRSPGGVFREAPPVTAGQSFGAGFGQQIRRGAPRIAEALGFEDTGVQPSGVSGFAGQLAGGMLDPQSVVATAATLGAGAALPAAGQGIGRALSFGAELTPALQSKLAAAIGPRAAQSVAATISSAAGGGSVAATAEATAIPFEEWASDPVGSALRVARAAGMGAAGAGVVGGGLGAVLPVGRPTTPRDAADAKVAPEPPSVPQAEPTPAVAPEQPITRPAPQEVLVAPRVPVDEAEVQAGGAVGKGRQTEGGQNLQLAPQEAGRPELRGEGGPEVQPEVGSMSRPDLQAELRTRGMVETGTTTVLRRRVTEARSTAETAVPPPEPVASPAAKEAWEMTGQELLDLRGKVRSGEHPKLDIHTTRRDAFVEYKRVSYIEDTGSKYAWDSMGARDAERVHRREVEAAIREGRPLPPEVLADYPDLAATTGKPPPTIPENIPKAKGGLLPYSVTFENTATKQRTTVTVNAKDAADARKRARAEGNTGRIVSVAAKTPTDTPSAPPVATAARSKPQPARVPSPEPAPAKAPPARAAEVPDEAGIADAGESKAPSPDPTTPPAAKQETPKALPVTPDIDYGAPKDAMGAAAAQSPSVAARSTVRDFTARLFDGAREKGDAMLRQIAGHSAPKVSAASESSGNALIRYASARMSAQPIADDMTARVLGPKFKDADFAARVGGVLVEDRLRAVRAGLPPNQQGAVGTIVGAQFSPFKTDADFRAALNDPEIQATIARHKRFVQEPAEKVHKELGGRMAGKGTETGAFVNLLAVEPDRGAQPAGPTGARGNLRNPLKRKSRFNVRATGSADAYSIHYPDLVKNTIGGNIERHALKRMYDAMIRDGLAVVKEQGEPAPTLGGKPSRAIQNVEQWAFPMEGPEGPTARLKSRNLWVRSDLYPEVRNALNVDAEFREAAAARVAQLLNTIQIAGPTDAVWHVANIMSAVTGSPGGKNWFTHLAKRTPGVNILDAVGRVASETIRVVRDSPEVRADIARLFKIGAGRETHVKGWMSKVQPLGKAIEIIDRAGRLAMDGLYQNLVDRGLVKASEQGRREFVNQVGQYNSRLQGRIQRTAKELGISPFIVAGRNFNRMGWRRVMASPGVRAANPKAWVALRAAELGGTLVSFAAVPMTLNYLTQGSVFGRPGVPIGAIDLGSTTEDGKPRFIDPAKWIGLRRGLRITGLQAVMEGMRYGQTSGNIAEDAVRDMLSGVVHPWAGPAAEAALTTATGRGAYGAISGFQETPVAKPGENQFAVNALAAIKELNPVVGSFLEGHEQTGTIGGGLREFGRSLGGAIGIGGKKPPNVEGREKAETMERRMFESRERRRHGEVTPTRRRRRYRDR